MFDVAIIGAGPAGISAALTLTALNKKIIWFGSKKLSSKIRAAEQIRNYTGLTDISGENMAKSFAAQTEAMGIEITEKKRHRHLPHGGAFRHPLRPGGL